jgi:uncharacterized protein (DUF362 family)/Pyruvate/2-oxoacid:ferredoxin oxidoreductase delta subunit
LTESSPRPSVALVRCESYEPQLVRDAVSRALDLLGGAGRFVQPSEQIVLKPNLLVGRAPDRAVTTHPAVFRAVAEILRDHGCHLSYGDSPGYPGSTSSQARRSGLEAEAERLDIPLADFHHGEVVHFPEGDLIKRFTLARGVVDADGLVSLPKMKAHGLTRITGAMKNQFGCIPGMLKAEFHARLPSVDLFSRMLSDLNRLLRPRLFVLDGIVAMEGNGPQSGTPRPMNLIAVSEDPVALDTVFCHLIGLDPALVGSIVHGQKTGLGGGGEVETLGDPLTSLANHEFDVNRSPRSTTGEPGRLSRLARRLIVPRPAVDGARCTRCGTCVTLCPVNPKAIDFERGDRRRPPNHRYDRCIRCYCCQELCPEGAIDIHVPALGRLLHR